MNSRKFQQVDEIVADNSSSNNESFDEILEVNPQAQDQVQHTQNSHNVNEVSNRSNYSNSLEHQNNFTYPPTKNVCTCTENYSHQDQVLNNSEDNRIPLGHFVEKTIFGNTHTILHWWV